MPVSSKPPDMPRIDVQPNYRPILYERDLIVAWLRRLAGDVDARGAETVARIVRAIALAIEEGKHEG